MPSIGGAHPVLRRSLGNGPESLLLQAPGFVSEMCGRKYEMSILEQWRKTPVAFLLALYFSLVKPVVSRQTFCVGAESN